MLLYLFVHWLNFVLLNFNRLFFFIGNYNITNVSYFVAIYPVIIFCFSLLSTGIHFATFFVDSAETPLIVLLRKITTTSHACTQPSPSSTIPYIHAGWKKTFQCWDSVECNRRFHTPSKSLEPVFFFSKILKCCIYLTLKISQMLKFLSNPFACLDKWYFLSNSPIIVKNIIKHKLKHQLYLQQI